MAKTFLLLFPAAVLFSFYNVCGGLECYHCYQGKKVNSIDGNFVPCDEKNLTLSNVWLCPSPTARCVYETVELTFSKDLQIWRTCSNGIADPCDPNSLPPGVKMVDCTHCGTDRCNLQKKKEENEKRDFTFNINANVNLFIRKLD